eukprot:COSAG06_NODE_61868_length_266_cov_1.077844_1_plen_34_part_10
MEEADVEACPQLSSSTVPVLSQLSVCGGEGGGGG